MNLTVKLIEKDIKNSYNGIKTLWNRVFGDDEEFIDRVIASPSYRGAVCAFADGELAGAAHLIAFSGREDALYCYAVATSEKYRGRGVCSEILRFLRQYSDNSGKALLLHPASRSLKFFYEERGFKPLSYTYSFSCVGDGGDIRSISAKEYVKLRDFAFGGRGYYGWSEDILLLSGLEFTAFQIDGEYCAAAVYEGRIFEICASSAVYGKAVRRAASCFKDTSVLEQTDMPVGAVCSVMGYNVKEFTYFNLFLD